MLGVAAKRSCARIFPARFFRRAGRGGLREKILYAVCPRQFCARPLRFVGRAETSLRDAPRNFRRGAWRGFNFGISGGAARELASAECGKFPIARCLPFRIFCAADCGAQSFAPARRGGRGVRARRVWLARDFQKISNANIRSLHLLGYCIGSFYLYIVFEIL